MSPDGSARRPDDPSEEPGAEGGAGPSEDQESTPRHEPTPRHRPTPRHEPGRPPGSAGPEGGGGDGEVARDSAEAPEPVREPVPFTQQLGRALLVVLAVLFGVFAVFNAHFVDFSWVFGSTEVVTDPDGERVSGGVPLIVLLVASFLAGAVIAWAVTVQAARARRARERREDGERRSGR